MRQTIDRIWKAKKETLFLFGGMCFALAISAGALSRATKGWIAGLALIIQVVLALFILATGAIYAIRSSKFN
jgi:hypothetical protein